jgi:hypothetical protein
MTTSFTRGENPLRADKLNQAFSERLNRQGDTMQGMLTLWHDPVGPFDAATKQYIDRIATTSSSSGVINVKDYGAKGDGTTDDTAAISAAIGAGNCVVSFPRGIYKITSSVVLPSYTRLQGSGSSQSIIRPTGLTQPCFLTTNWSNRVSAGWDASPWPPTTSTNQTDVQISLEGLAFDFSQNLISGQSGWGIFSLLLAKNISINDIQAYTGQPGGAVFGYSGFQIMGCDDVRISNYVAINVTNAVDCWKGPTRIKVSNSLFESNDAGGNGGLINYNAIGAPNDFNQNDDLKVINTTFWLHGATAIYLDPTGGGSSTNNVAVTNCEIVAKPSASSTVSVGIMGRGPGGNVQLSNIVIRAENGVTVREGIELSAFYGNAAATSGTGIISTQSGSRNLTITTTGTDVGPGNFVLIDNGSGGPVVGNGLSLQGFYPVTAVSGPQTGYNSGTIITATATANATATGPINVASHVQGYWGTMNNCQISNIVFDGVVGQSGNYLINLGGSGHRVNGVTVTQNYQGAAGPSYLGVVGVYSIADQAHPYRKSQVLNIIADPGTGALPAGYSGDNVVMWTNQGPAPDQVTAGLSLIIGSSSGPTWTTGSAAPSSIQPVGSLYSRIGGALGATLYVSRGAGTWAAVAGV